MSAALLLLMLGLSEAGRADGPSPASAPMSTATSAPAPAPKPTSSSDPSNRTPGSLDSQNTYHAAGGEFSQPGSPVNKEPVIDGKTIPKVIDFSEHKTNVGGTAAPAKRPAKPKRTTHKRAEKEEDDGLNVDD